MLGTATPFGGLVLRPIYYGRFERMWRFYLSYCQAGFTLGSIDVMQVALTRR
jgi:cyclopropane-fatty-acyl-phospholipid synthase